MDSHVAEYLVISRRITGSGAYRRRMKRIQASDGDTIY